MSEAANAEANGGHGGPPSRKHPAHMPVFTTGNQSTIVFVTVCTKARKPILACADTHTLLREAWTDARLWRVGRYVIMPDHIHLFAAPAVSPAEPIRSWTAFWKSYAARHWPRPVECPIWQADIWDTQLRATDNYSAKWTYVRENPVRAGLVHHAEAWPYQGELNVLRWHNR